VIHADIPGVKPEDIDISMHDGVLDEKTEAKTENAGYKRVERTYGSFYRRFSLPDTANADAISAASKHGVLEVVIPKREAVQPKKINVTATES
jgi:HSP20 family protein